MSKRKLTEEEINDVLDFLRPGQVTNLLNLKEVIKRKQYCLLSQQLSQVEIYPHKIPQLKQWIYRDYITSQVEPGYMAGIHAAASLGEPITQQTMKTFQSAGVSDVTTLQGVPRIEELMHASKSIKYPTMSFIYRIPQSESSCELSPTSRESNLYSLDEIRLKANWQNYIKAALEERYVFDLLDGEPDIVKDQYISLSKDEKEWYDLFAKVYAISNFEEIVKSCQWSVRFFISKQEMYIHKITLQRIASLIEEEYEDVFCVYSPEGLAIIDVYLLTSISPARSTSKIGALSHTKEEEYIIMRDVLIPRVKILHISGVKKIEEVIVKGDNMREPMSSNSLIELSVQTVGSNMKEIFTHFINGIDYSTVITNNIHEVYNTLGIEAARQAIIDELTKVFTMGQGQMDDIVHLELLADTMTNKGIIVPITKKCVNLNSGPLTRASFEQSTENLAIAARKGEIENMQNISACSMLGQYSTIGTGLCELISKI